ncbi:MAG: hypothetical protein COB02_01940 [Candidatus Cloacimonadota bacterium]|nr:MAG: hypothetical protein COB02_01940 [Candidatus Cloacimonadota bacterium]
MESEFNLSKELCEKILTVYLLELNQTSKVNPAEKYYFKNLNSFLKISPESFKKIKKETSSLRPANPQDRMIDLKAFFLETKKTLAESHPNNEQEDILKYIAISMDCSSHFTLESLDQLIQESTNNLVDDSSQNIEEEVDFFSPIEEDSPFDITDDEDFNFSETSKDGDTLFPPSIDKITSEQTIALPKINISLKEKLETKNNQEPTKKVNPPDQIENNIDEKLVEEILNENELSEVSSEEEQKKPKKKKFQLPKVSFNKIMPAITSRLQSPIDSTIIKLKINNSENSFTHPKIRVLSSLIDTVFLMIPFIVAVPIHIILSTIGLGIVGSLLQVLLSSLIIFYYFKMETSTYQGTIGKILCKIKIVDKDNQILSDKQALIRSLLKFGPMLFSSLISIIATFIPMISILTLISAVLSFGIFIGMFYAFIHKQRQGLHDVLAKCYVVGIDTVLSEGDFEVIIETSTK